MTEEKTGQGPELGPQSTECFSIDICRYKETDDTIRMVVSEFNGKLYLSIRRWFWSPWDEDYFPTKDGITMQYSDEQVDGMLNAFAHILSNKELGLLYEFRNRKAD